MMASSVSSAFDCYKIVFDPLTNTTQCIGPPFLYWIGKNFVLSGDYGTTVDSGFNFFFVLSAMIAFSLFNVVTFILVLIRFY